MADRRTTLLAPGMALLAALAALAIPALAAGGRNDPPKPDLSTSGNRAELIESIPITTAPSADTRVVMSLGPEQLPDLVAGSRLRASAEVQVSTTCVEQSSRCVGSRYEYNPRAAGQIVLSSSTDPAAPAIALSSPREVLCKQRRPNRNHHCTIAFPNVDTTVDPATLPCLPDACYANLVLTSWNPAAQPDDVVVLGADRPDGSVEGDKGRLNVIQLPASSTPTELSSSELVNPRLPLIEPDKVKRRVVHSVALPALKEGEVLSFDGSYVTGISALSFNAFISSRVILAETPTSTGTAGLARTVANLRGDATESNGFNCTKGPSGYRNPCTTVKAGAIRIIRDAVDPSGQPATLYLNLVGAAKPLLTTDAREIHQVGLQPSGGLSVSRYGP